MTSSVFGRPKVSPSLATVCEDSRKFVISYVLQRDRRVSFAEHIGERVPGRGLLLQSSERGVIFPVVHVMDYRDEVCGVQQRIFQDNDEISLGKDYTLQQGLYEEVKKVVVYKDPSTFSSIHRPLKNSKGYILMGFRSIHWNFNQLMVDTWREWTGVRCLERYLPASLGLSCIRFFQSSQVDLFTYVVLAECSTGTATADHHWRLLDFVQRMRVERINGYISVYTQWRSRINL